MDNPRKPEVGKVVAYRLDEEGLVWGTAEVLAIGKDALTLSLWLDEEWAARRSVSPFSLPYVTEEIEAPLSGAGDLWK